MATRRNSQALVSVQGLCFLSPHGAHVGWGWGGLPGEPWGGGFRPLSPIRNSVFTATHTLRQRLGTEEEQREK